MGDGAGNREPINILKPYDYELQYKCLESTMELAENQRDGVFGTAEKMIQCLTSRNTLRWLPRRWLQTPAVSSVRTLCRLPGDECST